MTATAAQTPVTGGDFRVSADAGPRARLEFYGGTLGLPCSLEGRGVTYIFDTGVPPGFFREPDGNALMLHHRYAPRTAPA